MSRIRLVSFILLFLSACQPTLSEVHETRFMMGTLVRFTVIHSNTKQAQLAIRQAAQEMQRVEAVFTIYGQQPNDIKAFNNGAINTLFHFPTEINSLLKTALHIEQQSHGAFSPTLGSLDKLWGFSKPTPPHTPPLPDAIQLRLKGSQHCIQYKEHQWLRTSAYCQLDFGGIAKGYAIDQGIKVLQRYGIKNAMINAGGDIRMIGKHGKHDWHIGIRDPRHKDHIIATLSLHGDVSIVTSGDYERYYIYNGQRYHHILNPKTGHPSYKSQSTTVIAPTATLADAWSTALFINGKKGLAMIKGTAIQALIIDARGQYHSTIKNVTIQHSIKNSL